jgi:GT2 family glycosyltransferase
MEPALVSVTIVTHNSAQFICRCLDAVFQLEYRPLEVIVVDNASEDNSKSLLARYRDRIRLIENGRNAGFAAGQNQAIAASRGQWILTLNPDVLVRPGFVQRLVEAGDLDVRVGAVCGKLLRIGRDFAIPRQPRIDSTGIYFTPSLRHFDRGWNEPDDGRFARTEYVFGACAAAALYRREMIGDVSLEGGFFDPDFFIYREDADVAWRSQMLGWHCIYAPGALAYHVRSVVPGSRPAVPAILKMHSVKNRFLMRVKNMTGDLYRRHWRAATARDLLVMGGCLLYEPGSLPAFWRLALCLPRALAERRRIMERRTATDEYLASWFHASPASRPFEPWMSDAATEPGVVENQSARSLAAKGR